MKQLKVYMQKNINWKITAAAREAVAMKEVKSVVLNTDFSHILSARNKMRVFQVHQQQSGRRANAINEICVKDIAPIYRGLKKVAAEGRIFPYAEWEYNRKYIPFQLCKWPEVNPFPLFVNDVSNPTIEIKL